MVTDQPILLNRPTNKQQNPQQYSGGPVFKPAPGWGFYVKKWLKKHFLRIVAPVLVVIIAVWIFAARKSAEDNKGITNIKETVKISVVHGDGRARLARKALSEYLKENPQEILIDGQKLFIEEILRRKSDNQKLTVGETAEFLIENIKTAVAQAKQLTPFQLQKWEEYAKKVKF